MSLKIRVVLPLREWRNFSLASQSRDMVRFCTHWGSTFSGDFCHSTRPWSSACISPGSSLGGNQGKVVACWSSMGWRSFGRQAGRICQTCCQRIGTSGHLEWICRSSQARSCSRHEYRYSSGYLCSSDEQRRKLALIFLRVCTELLYLPPVSCHFVGLHRCMRALVTVESDWSSTTWNHSCAFTLLWERMCFSYALLPLSEI